MPFHEHMISKALERLTLVKRMAQKQLQGPHLKASFDEGFLDELRKHASTFVKVIVPGSEEGGHRVHHVEVRRGEDPSEVARRKVYERAEFAARRIEVTRMGTVGNTHFFMAKPTKIMGKAPKPVRKQADEMPERGTLQSKRRGAPDRPYFVILRKGVTNPKTNESS